MGCDYPNTFLQLCLFRGAIRWQCLQLPKHLLLILRIATTVVCSDLLYSAKVCVQICCTVPKCVFRSAVQCQSVCSDLLYSATVCSDLLYSAKVCALICCTVPKCVL
jgi:hypothetical protein